MAVIKNNQTANAVFQGMLRSTFDWYIFPGLSKTEGEWVIHGTSEKLTWDNWRREPDENEHCSYFDPYAEKIVAIDCAYNIEINSACDMAQVTFSKVLDFYNFMIFFKEISVAGSMHS